MITTKYLLADLIRFIIQHLADEKDEHMQQAVQFLIQAKNALLSATFSEHGGITDHALDSAEEDEITKAVED